MKYIVVLILLFSWFSTLSQISNLSDFSGQPIQVREYNRIEGSPYLNDDWVIGNFRSVHNQNFENIPMRYNSYEDALVIQKNGQSIMLDNEDVIFFQFSVIDNNGILQEYIFKNGYNFNEVFDSTEYFRVLFEAGKFKILEKVKTIEITVTPAAYGESDFQKFLSDNETYIVDGNDIEKTRINNRSLGNVFPKYKVEIKKFIKTNDLDLSNQSDIRKIGNYIVSHNFVNE